eukprot:scaffold89674_cov25-Tisochrysis_lutea.AAC.4
MPVAPSAPSPLAGSAEIPSSASNGVAAALGVKGSIIPAAPEGDAIARAASTRITVTCDASIASVRAGISAAVAAVRGTSPSSDSTCSPASSFSRVARAPEPSTMRSARLGAKPASERARNCSAVTGRPEKTMERRRRPSVASVDVLPAARSWPTTRGGGASARRSARDTAGFILRRNSAAATVSTPSVGIASAAAMLPPPLLKGESASNGKKAARRSTSVRVIDGVLDDAASSRAAARGSSSSTEAARIVAASSVAGSVPAAPFPPAFLPAMLSAPRRLTEAGLPPLGPSSSPHNATNSRQSTGLPAARWPSSSMSTASPSACSGPFGSSIREPLSCVLASSVARSAAAAATPGTAGTPATVLKATPTSVPPASASPSTLSAALGTSTSPAFVSSTPVAAAPKHLIASDLAWAAPVERHTASA